MQGLCYKQRCQFSSRLTLELFMVITPQTLRIAILSAIRLWLHSVFANDNSGLLLPPNLFLEIAFKE